MCNYIGVFYMEVEITSADWFQDTRVDAYNMIMRFDEGMTD